MLENVKSNTAHPWCDGHSTSISTCRVSKRELHTHIHLDYVRVEFYLVSKKKMLKLLQILLQYP